MRSWWVLLSLVASIWSCTSPAHAEDGYELWLRYGSAEFKNAARTAGVSSRVSSDELDDPTIKVAVSELTRALGGLETLASAPTSSLAVLVGTRRSASIAALDLPLARVGEEGFVLRRARVNGVETIVIAANRPIGALYGSFALLRRIGSGASLAKLNVIDQPKVRLRMLNHWDNLDRHVERGYSGQSIWDWWRLPDINDPRYTDYARANASIGINGTVLNNVNAKAESLTAPYIAKAAAIADVLRPYGIKVYLSARFSAPVELGGLKTADPLDPSVRAWWKAKADEIYRMIPDFGGFLVKANSEGQPGPRDYRRTHADGANALAAAVGPHGGIVMWRAFVYAETDPEDRAKQAYTEFKPLDGKFASNVLVQVKNGPIDFQPREPFHPLFGAMPKTPLMVEFQLTKEYLGFSTHLAYLGTMFAETLESDTFAKGRGSTVARVVDGSLEGHRLTGMAGVANIGSDRNWAGSVFDQANWFAFGRLAWDPGADPLAIAKEWTELTWSHDPAVVRPVVDMMMRSRQAVVDYMTPLGLAHLMATGHHYGPGPWVSDLQRPEWNPTYYHRADRNGIGFDRTRTGSNAVAQYARPVARRFADPNATGEDLLLWFHHLSWDRRMGDGRSLWETLVRRYDRGVADVTTMRRDWEQLRSRVDPERWEQTASALAVQEREAQWWRDASIAYFRDVSGRPTPAGVAEPAHDLDWYKAQSFPYAPGQGK
jgi:alpha-glucuronidase